MIYGLVFCWCLAAHQQEVMDQSESKYQMNSSLLQNVIPKFWG